MRIEQGDILKVQRQSFPVIVVSNNFFNESGKVIVCPIQEKAAAGPLHLPLKSDLAEGYILCEQLHYLDLQQRTFSKIGTISYFDVTDFSDAIMGIFDYQMN